jgi:uncharacterized protein YydD (DUF2326 family)
MDGVSHMMRMMVIAWAIGICSCAHDPSQVLVLHHSSTSDRHEIAPQSKLRVRLNDGSDLGGFTLDATAKTLGFQRLVMILNIGS